MKFKFNFILISALFLGGLCSCSEKGGASSEKGQIVLSVSLDNKIAGAKNSESNELDWKEEDRPVLFQINEKGRSSWKSPIDFTALSDGRAEYSYQFRSQKGECKYWLYKSEGQPAPEDDGGTTCPLCIIPTQTPQLQGVDPKADVLVSSLSFSFPQTYFEENTLDIGVSRLNAVAEIELAGIPQDYSLKSMSFVAGELIVGKQVFDFVEKKFVAGSELSSSINVAIEGGLRTASDNEGKRKIWLSMWPVVLRNYDISLVAVDVKGGEHIFTRGFDASDDAIELRSGKSVSWTVNMREEGAKPELPATPQGPEDIIEGKEGRTLELFTKIKNYGDNGIESINRWKTHRLGYEGAVVHEAELSQYGELLHVWLIEADPNKVSFAVGTPYDGNTVPPSSLQTVSGQVKSASESGKKVLAAVNGDAWGAKGGNYTYGIMFKDGKYIKKWAVAPNDIANTDTFYATDTGKVGIVDENAWKEVISNNNIENAIGGWYRLISQGGEPYAQPGAKDGDPLLRDKRDQFMERNPRTFMGVSEDRVFIFVVDGRQPGWSAGLTLNGAARMCYSIGCKRAVNMDGGGSTAIVKRDHNKFSLLNKPSDKKERNVANSLMVIAR